MTLAEAQQRFSKAAGRLDRKRPGATIPHERDPDWRPVDVTRDRFPEWREEDVERAPAPDAQLYYWRDTFWNRSRAN